MRQSLVAFVLVAFGIVIQAKAATKDSVHIIYKFSIYTCAGQVGEALECEINTIEERRLQLPFMANGGSCINLDRKADHSSLKSFPELKFEELGGGVSCVYSAYRDSAFPGIYLPLFLVEKNEEGVSALKMSLARSFNGETRIQVSDFTAGAESLRLGNLSYKLRGEEIHRTTTKLVYPVFEVLFLE